MEKQKKTSIERIIGLFLNAFFNLETFMSDFIAFHIIEFDYSIDGEKRKEFYERFLDRASYQRKAELVSNIIRDKFPQLKNKISKKSLEEIGKLRNIIAHSEDILNLEVDESSPEKTLVREYSRGSMTPIRITFDEVELKTKSAISIMKILNDEVKKMKDKCVPFESYFASQAKKSVPPFPK